MRKRSLSISVTNIDFIRNKAL